MVPAQNEVYKKLKTIQRLVTDLVPELQDLSYKRRLQELQLITLEDSRGRGDLITKYKLIN